MPNDPLESLALPYSTFAPPFERFVAPARQKPQLWRFVLGVALVVLIYLLWMLAMGVVVWLSVGLEGLEGALVEIALGSSPKSLLILLTTFFGLALGCFAAVRWLHGRKIGSLFGRAPVVLRDFVLGLGAIAAVSIVGFTLSSGSYQLLTGVDLHIWLIFLPAALLGLLVQTGAEELVFRGYLQQQLAARFSSPVIWLGLPTILFGLAHFSPEIMGENTWLVIAATTLFGLAAADLTARSGSIGLSWGIHFGNNIIAILLITTGGGLDGLALYRFPFGPDDVLVMRPLILIDLAVLSATWGLCRLALRRR
jgi:membrane protease YdiL (CAAX protease family)